MRIEENLFPLEGRGGYSNRPTKINLTNVILRVEYFACVLVNHVQLKLLVRVHHIINLSKCFKGEKKSSFRTKKGFL